MEKIPPYAILSHTWEPAPTGEQSHQDVVKIQEKYKLLSASDDEASSDPLTFAPTPRPYPIHRSIWDPDSGLSSKIRVACKVARRDGYRYIWIDSSCIDKSSSSELSEAINSMCNWYRGAQVCYAFLADVPFNEDVRAENSMFRKSRWFTRGWTLQELIAPRVVVFFSQEWKGLGTKDALADIIQDITFIDREILTHKIALSDESVAERMRWAARRETTRVEDEAYSLLGIFEITMPTLYGEGRHAFRRLQEEILRRIPDQSLFAWGTVCLPTPQEPSDISVDDGDTGSPFASSPSSFELSEGKIIRASGPDFESLKLPVEEYIHTPYGIRTQLCFLPLQAFNLTVSGGSQPGVGAWYLVILASQKNDDRERLLSKLCYIDYAKSNVNFLHVPERLQLSRTGGTWSRDAFIFTVSLDDLARAKTTRLEMRTVYLPHPKPFAARRRLGDNHPQLKLSLSTWAKDVLQLYRCTMSDICSTKLHPNTYSFNLFSASFTIHVQYRHMLVDRTWLPIALVIEARIWILSDEHDKHDQSEMVQHTPPYMSAIWTDEEPWAMTLPLRDADLLTDSGDNVNLQLGLGLSAPSHYNIRVEVATTQTPVVTQSVPELSTRAISKHLHTVIEGPHAEITLTMLGSVRRALEAAGYAVDLEGPEPNQSWYRSYSCSLRPTTPATDSAKFTVLIQYFVTLQNSQVSTDDWQGLVVAARVTLKSSSTSPRSSDSDLVEGLWQDGPYVVVWRDRTPTWRWSHEQMQVCLNTPTGEFITLHLGLDLAWQSEYYLLVSMGHSSGPSSFQPRDLYGDFLDELDEPQPCGTISFTLPGQVKRALQADGYKVDLEASNEGHPDCYSLSLSSSSLTISIKYSHHLSTDPVFEEQRSAWRACITVLTSSPTIQGSPTRILDWDLWKPTKGWRWDLPKRDAEFTLATGQELTLRLGFYLAWLPEYCLTIEVNPHSHPHQLDQHLNTDANPVRDEADGHVSGVWAS
ncbi:hypothetical protein V8D89_005617 [Ganoderma adspersum]